MRKFKFYSFILGALLCSYSFVAWAEQTLDHIVAIVDNDVITRQELLSRVVDVRRQMASRGAALSDDEALSKQVLERMIIDKIQLDRALRLGIRVDDLSLNKSLENIAQNNNLTLPELREVLVNEGGDFENFREQVRQEIIIQRLQKREVFDRINVSEQEIQQLLERQKQAGSMDIEYRLGHILITTPEAAIPEQVQEARQQADEVLRELRAGADFSQTAVRYSAGQMALEGGDLGWRNANQLPSLFVEALKNMRPGDISAPLRSATGFHILKLIDQKSERHIIEQTHARHILIQLNEITDDEKARRTLLELKARLDAGEDFAALAQKHSQDPGSKAAGGDLGWAGKGAFAPRFEQVMTSLAPGQISEPFRTEFGWHIVQVLERRQQDETEQIQRSEAEIAIKRRKSDEELQLWLRQLRDQAYVEYLESALK